MNAHTPGPWFADAKGYIWRRDPAELYQNGGSVAGDKPLAEAFKGWHGADQQGYPVEANAHLIAAAPKFFAGAEEFIAYESSVKSGDDTMAMVHFALASKLLREAYDAATGAQP
ncbi:hypothetical protein [Pseudoxanthomonas sp. USHLN014]|uniref:hypothetical protein n=1 Tax=Pseudoxanthomonas sp. USHLN014 TaxID=3081297 RepID=UPI00301D6409